MNKPDEQPDNNFLNLPEEMLLLIFSFLDKETLVKTGSSCSYLRNIIFNEAGLWHLLGGYKIHYLLGLSNEKFEEDTIYLKHMHMKNRSYIVYKVIDPSGILHVDTIRFNNNSLTLFSDFDTHQFRQQILNITSKRGHTQRIEVLPLPYYIEQSLKRHSASRKLNDYIDMTSRINKYMEANKIDEASNENINKQLINIKEHYAEHSAAFKNFMRLIPLPFGVLFFILYPVIEYFVLGDCQQETNQKNAIDCLYNNYLNKLLLSKLWYITVGMIFGFAAKSIESYVIDRHLNICFLPDLRPIVSSVRSTLTTMALKCLKLRDIPLLITSLYLFSLIADEYKDQKNSGITCQARIAIDSVKGCLQTETNHNLSSNYGILFAEGFTSAFCFFSTLLLCFQFLNLIAKLGNKVINKNSNSENPHRLFNHANNRRELTSFVSENSVEMEEIDESSYSV